MCMPEKDEITLMEAIREALQEEMRRDENIILLGEDIARHGGGFGLTRGLWEEFGDDRVLNTPISENGFVGVALGAAVTGLHPVVEFMFMDFAMVAMDQICNQAAKIRFMSGGQTKAPMVLRCPQGGLSWKSAAAQHSQSLEAWFVHIPGLKVVFPSTPADAKGLMKSAVRDDNPIIFIEHKALYGEKGIIQPGNTLVPIGKADIKKEGCDATIISYGYMLHRTLEAAELLKDLGLDVEILDLRTLKPVDEISIFNSIKKTHRAVIVQEAPRLCGMAAEIGMMIEENCFDDLDAPIIRLTGEDVPVPFADSLECEIWPTVEEIVSTVREICYH